MSVQDGNATVNLLIDGESSGVDRIDGQSSVQYTFGDTPLYQGEYTFTPSDEIQTVRIADKKAEQNIVINPIPSNYGKVTWNGSYLYIS